MKPVPPATTLEVKFLTVLVLAAAVTFHRHGRRHLHSHPPRNHHMFFLLHHQIVDITLSGSRKFLGDYFQVRCSYFLILLLVVLSSLVLFLAVLLVIRLLIRIVFRTDASRF